MRSESLPGVIALGAIIILMAVAASFSRNTTPTAVLDVSVGASQAWPITPLLIAVNATDIAEDLSTVSSNWEDAQTGWYTERVTYPVRSHPTWLTVEVVWFEVLTGRRFVSRVGLKTRDFGVSDGQPLVLHLGIQFGRNGHVVYSNGSDEIIFSPCGGQYTHDQYELRITPEIEADQDAVTAAARGLAPPQSPCRAPTF